jgi:glucose/mannose-6-phosphate isomerase
MGGSGISGDILKALYPDVLIISNKDYSIPEYCDAATLAILISYSGNTEETLNNYTLLLRRNARRVIISSGGTLLDLAGDLKVKIPPGLPPRGALGYLFAPLPMTLYRFGMIPRNPEPALIALAKFLKTQRNTIERRAKALSKKCVDRLPIIYATSSMFLPVARRWQCQLNENAKVLAHINVIPEMNHNEIVGLGKPDALNSQISMIFLHDPAAHPRNKLRVQFLKGLIENKFAHVLDVTPEGTNHMQRMFWTIMLGDFLSYYVAIRMDIDPLPVKRIDELKKYLAGH